MREEREKQQKPLTEHEENVQDLLLRISEAVKGFPETDRGLENVTRAWAKFMSLEPHRVYFDPQAEQYMSPEDKEPYMWKEGIVPGEWLIEQIRDGCEFLPAPIAAREIYCEAGFKPLDGKQPSDFAGWRRSGVKTSE